MHSRNFIYNLKNCWVIFDVKNDLELPVKFVFKIFQQASHIFYKEVPHLGLNGRMQKLHVHVIS